MNTHNPTNAFHGSHPNSNGLEHYPENKTREQCWAEHDAAGAGRYAEVLRRHRMMPAGTYERFRAELEFHGGWKGNPGVLAILTVLPMVGVIPESVRFELLGVLTLAVLIEAVG